MAQGSGTSRDGEKTGSHNKITDEEKGLWSSMLGSVASSKKLPEKKLLVLGGTPDSQTEFFELLNHDVSKHQRDRAKIPVANQFGLGYNYLDVLDADHEDNLARLSIYTLSDSSKPFAPLLNPLLQPETIPETLMVILLDWTEPRLWIRQLQEWIKLFGLATKTASQESKDTMQSIMTEWQEKKRGPSVTESLGQSNGVESNVTLPLNQGEWDEALGLPLCVVCMNSHKINDLEAEQSWREEDFDFVLQSLRTVLMKHGASLVYVAPTQPNSMPTLIHSSLGIHSTLKKDAIKHNIIDRDKILVPPGWDSWGKIMVLREGFDVQGFSQGWSNEIIGDGPQPAPDAESQAKDSIISLYESTVKSNRPLSTGAATKITPGIEVSVPNMQTFLAAQQETLTRLAAEDEKASATSTSSAATSNSTGSSYLSSSSTNTALSDQFGSAPVQVNMGGISVDADDVLRKLQQQSLQRKKDEDAVGDFSGSGQGTSTPSRPVGSGGREGTPTGAAGHMSTPEMKAQNEKLQDFFSGLMKRGANNSPRGGAGGAGTPSKLGRSAGTPASSNEKGS